MDVFVTGATGFIGGVLTRKLIERGDRVTALVRTPAKARHLEEIGVTLVQGDLDRVDVMREAMAGKDAAIHGAAVYKVGIRADERQPMIDTNVQGTANTLRAAREAGVPRVVYVSTVGIFGNTNGKIADETFQRDPDYLSLYDETKHKAHLIARQMINEGLPCIIVQPGAVYGPGDRSEIANTMNMFLDGKMP
ncbi:MAG TPA: NAD-dependent epimerase/dehydratase family protein, partial [Actinomycetota bacterium]|nr:NAD-dependent epimerase/dehydratase family protein [Actinomycetota bacterium]